MQQKLIDYLIKKKLDMVNQENVLISEKCKLRELGKYRKINNMNESILIFSARIKSLEFLIVFITNLIFKSDTNSISGCLSPYGVFCDRTNFYYEKNILDHYSDDYIIQIIMCEIFNSLQDYFIKSELSDIRKLKYRGRSLILLHHIGLISENISLYDMDEKIIENFYNKYPSVKIIT